MSDSADKDPFGIKKYDIPVDNNLWQLALKSADNVKFPGVAPAVAINDLINELIQTATGILKQLAAQLKQPADIAVMKEYIMSKLIGEVVKNNANNDQISRIDKIGTFILNEFKKKEGQFDQEELERLIQRLLKTREISGTDIKQGGGDFSGGWFTSNDMLHNKL